MTKNLIFGICLLAGLGLLYVSFANEDGLFSDDDPNAAANVVLDKSVRKSTENRISSLILWGGAALAVFGCGGLLYENVLFPEQKKKEQDKTPRSV